MLWKRDFSDKIDLTCSANIRWDEYCNLLRNIQIDITFKDIKSLKDKFLKVKFLKVKAAFEDENIKNDTYAKLLIISGNGYKKLLNTLDFTRLTHDQLNNAACFAANTGNDDILQYLLTKGAQLEIKYIRNFPKGKKGTYLIRNSPEALISRNMMLGIYTIGIPLFIYGIITFIKSIKIN